MRSLVLCMVLVSGACQSVQAEVEQTLVVRHVERVPSATGGFVELRSDEQIGVDRAKTKSVPGTLIMMATAFSLMTALLATEID